MVELYAKATPRPWRVVNYDAGDRSYYHFTPSIQAPEEEDCAVVHWDGFEQEYWQSAHGYQRAIHANAALIVHAVNNIEAREARIAQLEAAAQFLLDRLVDHEVRMTSDEDGREWYGHVTPAMARLRAALQNVGGSDE